MKVTTFHADPAKIRASRVLGPIPITLFFLSFPLLTNLARGFRNLFQFPGIADYWTLARENIILDYLLAAFAVLVLLLLNMLQAHPRLIAREHLRLDRDGLTQSERFRTRRWLWHDLPAFTHEANQSPPNIAFHLPGQDPDSLRQGEILDEYEAPLDEIAATLNEYRERAIRAPRGTSPAYATTVAQPPPRTPGYWLGMGSIIIALTMLSMIASHFMFGSIGFGNVNGAIGLVVFFIAWPSIYVRPSCFFSWIAVSAGLAVVTAFTYLGWILVKILFDVGILKDMHWIQELSVFFLALCFFWAVGFTIFSLSMHRNGLWYPAYSNGPRDQESR